MFGLVFTAVAAMSQVSSQHVRFRSVQLLREVLDELPEDSEVLGDALPSAKSFKGWKYLDLELVSNTWFKSHDCLFSLVSGVMRARMSDRHNAVRLQAIAGCARLHDDHAECDLAKDMMHQLTTLMGESDSKEIRKACIHAITLDSVTMPHLLARLEDVAADVRCTVFAVMGAKVAPAALPAKYAARLLKAGLTDRDSSVRKAAAKMIQSAWMPALGRNEVSVMALLNVERDADVAEDLAKYFSTQAKTAASVARLRPSDKALRLAATATTQTPEDEETEVIEHLAEAAFLWRVTIEEAHAASDLDRLDQLLPDPAILCSLIIAHRAHPLITQHLLGVAAHLSVRPIQANGDGEDTAAAKMLATLAENMLADATSCDHLSVPYLCRVLGRAYGLDNAQKRLLPSTHPYVVALCAVAKKSAVDLPPNASKSTPEEDDRWIRALLLAREALLVLVPHNATPMYSRSSANAQVSGAMEAALPLLDPVLLAVRRTRAEVRKAAIDALGAFCLMDVRAAAANARLLVAAVESDVPVVKIAAMRAMFDSLLWHGPEAIEVPPSGKGDAGAGAASSKGILKVLVKAMGSPGDVSERALTAVSGITRCLLTGAITASAELLYKLLKNTLAPAAASQPQLAQRMSAFWKVFAFSSVSNQHTLEKPVHAALKQLLSGNGSSDLAGAPLGSSVGFLLSLVDHESVVADPPVDLSGMSCRHDKVVQELAVVAAACPGGAHGTVALTGLHALVPAIEGIGVSVTTAGCVDALEEAWTGLTATTVPAGRATGTSRSAKGGKVRVSKVLDELRVALDAAARTGDSKDESSATLDKGRVAHERSVTDAASFDSDEARAIAAACACERRLRVSSRSKTQTQFLAKERQVEDVVNV
jgi:hypothetical protein